MSHHIFFFLCQSNFIKYSGLLFPARICFKKWGFFVFLEIPEKMVTNSILIVWNNGCRKKESAHCVIFSMGKCLRKVIFILFLLFHNAPFFLINPHFFFFFLHSFFLRVISKSSENHGIFSGKYENDIYIITVKMHSKRDHCRSIFHHIIPQ